MKISINTEERTVLLSGSMDLTKLISLLVEIDDDGARPYKINTFSELFENYISGGCVMGKRENKEEKERI